MAPTSRSQRSTPKPVAATAHAVFMLVACGALAQVGWTTATPSASHSCAHNDAPPSVAVLFGADVSPRVQARVQTLLAAAQHAPSCPHAGYVTVATAPAQCAQSELCLSLGDTDVTRALISAERLKALGPEGFALQGNVSSTAGGHYTLAAAGNPGTPPHARNDTAALDGGFKVGAARKPHSAMASIGATYAAYAALEALGLYFLHPLNATVPTAGVTVPSAAFAVDEHPQWAVRSDHYHTEHPLELTDVLQGMDAAGAAGYNESWASMLPQAESYFEWCVANHQNRVEWVLLWAADWSSFANSTLRQSRLKVLTTLAHDFGLAAGADVPIAEQQQHAWYMTNATGTASQQQADIAAHLDWAVAAGFDFLSTETGFSEFTHPSDTLMLSWMNFTAAYLRATYDIPAYIKVHSSSGQACQHYVDPRTGEPLNFNFLPIYADKGMGMMPHTLQIPSSGDPCGGAYGNTNFTFMYDFMWWQAEQPDNREIVWHPETGYWVNYDIDVPLFLPLYGERRLRDMRLIAAKEASAGFKLDGQNVFDSGWEWGYFLSAVVTARAAWCVPDASLSDSEAYAAALAPVVSVFDGVPSRGPSSAGSRDGGVGADIAGLLGELSDAQAQLLLFGNTTGNHDGLEAAVGVARRGVAGAAARSAAGAPASDTKLRNGMAYLIGFDGFADLERLAGDAMTQPDRVPLTELNSQSYKGPDYVTVLKPLLDAMKTTFAGFAARLVAMRKRVAPMALPLFDDMADALSMTALRARHVAAVYDAVWAGNDAKTRASRLADAMTAIQASIAVVARREASYRVPVQRIAGWRAGPTAYGYTYLWTVHSLYYMWRDYAIAQAIVEPSALAESDASLRLSPCYLNIQNPADVAFGEGWLDNVARWIRKELGGKGDSWAWIADCLGQPEAELVFPRDL